MPKPDESPSEKTETDPFGLVNMLMSRRMLVPWLESVEADTGDCRALLGLTLTPSLLAVVPARLADCGRQDGAAYAAKDLCTPGGHLGDDRVDALDGCGDCDLQCCDWECWPEEHFVAMLRGTSNRSRIQEALSGELDG